MTEVMIETAEQDFLKKRVGSAFNWANLARLLDPFYGSVDKYVEAYRVHLAALKKHASGDIDWYGVLGVEEEVSEVSTESITHTFVKLGKMINPEFHCSAAAPGAYKLISNAFEVLGDVKSRHAFHIRNGLALPPKEVTEVVPPKIKRPCVPRHGGRIDISRRRVI